MQSIWQADYARPSFPSLEEDIRTDVLIIGGGMCGVLCAYMLTHAGVDCVLAEAGTVGGGITKDTTAKITSQHGLVYQKLLREFGEEKTRMYYAANQAALEEYRRLCRDIPCDFEEKDAFVYERADRRKLEEELNALQRIGAQASLAENIPLPFPTVGAVRFARQAQFHPLKFLAAAARNLRIYEHTSVRELIGTEAVAGQGRIRAKAVIVATHFPFINKHGLYFLKMYQSRSYVLALSGAPDVGGMYVDGTEGGFSFRNYKNYLIVGGGSHRPGKKSAGWDALSALARQAYPDAREAFCWATQDCMTLDGAPYIGHYAKTTPNLYVATGFNKWGMTSSMVAAMLLRDRITGRENPYAPVFSPSRTILRPQLARNAGEAVCNLLSVSEKRCPHMGCALKWNAAEHSWDCPCHGSRFTQEGKRIDNPATGNLKK